ncbi:hypothetical protein KFK09_025429 [Dendrobium nobile]|uniref:Uncharacterized protein n=1 Tax=Dendrobium nobile TaxID=94219 RepID=A0A8T3AGC6_DENNO|nr:hypothetical protein KFK09_025429 [Dendrobium nobile]
MRRQNNKGMWAFCYWTCFFEVKHVSKTPFTPIQCKMNRREGVLMPFTVPTL